MIFDEAHSLFARLASRAGFEQRAAPRLDEAPPVPPHTEFWKSSYAQIIVVPLEATSVEAVKKTVQHAQEWLDLACMEEERRFKAVIDGYILFLIATQPSEELEIGVRALELDPTACRKHFAWPNEAADDPDLIWARIYRVTALGIPLSPISKGMTGSPLLNTKLQKMVLEDIKNLKGKAAARQHAETPSLAP
jgi:hypothetical protein